MKLSTTAISISGLAIILFFPLAGISHPINIPDLINKRSPQSYGPSSPYYTPSIYASYPGFYWAYSASYDGGNYERKGVVQDDSYDIASPSAPCMAGIPQEVNTATINLMEEFQPFSANPVVSGYDYGTISTIGYGHICSDAACSEVELPITQAAATQIFLLDIGAAETCVTRNVQVPLNANQYGALVSWAYNTNCVTKSDLFADLNAGQDPNTVAAAQLPLYILSILDGFKSPDLLNRRNAEVNLFQTPSTDLGTCP